MNKFLVALVGRPNVGKSALFNRFSGRRTAIVEDTPGVTRDRIYGICQWRDKYFDIIDTGGLEATDDRFAHMVGEQTKTAIAEADLILFVLDAREGVLPLDREILQQLHKSAKPVLIVTNKVDGATLPEKLAEFYTLGDQIFATSAEHGLGIGDLLDEVYNFLPEMPFEPEETNALKIALIGRPNVGKSSMLNYILGQERTLVSEIPGTTRDPLDTPFKIKNQPALLIDTAGIRKKGKVTLALEKFSIIKALQSIERADICLLLIDASEGVTEQDTNLAGYIRKAGKACIVVINKWDLLGTEQLPDTKTNLEYLADFKEKLNFIAYAPMVLSSAITGKGVGQIQELCLKVWEQANKKIPTPQLNQFIKRATEQHSIPTYKGKETKIYYLTQSGVCPPTFTLFVNRPDKLHFSYMRYLENQLRKAFDFRGTPIRLFPRLRQRSESKKSEA